MAGSLQLSTLEQEAKVSLTSWALTLCRLRLWPAVAPIMPGRKETCAAAACSVRYSPTRSGCGGRQRVVQPYLDHAAALLKPGVAVGDWICLTHRNALQRRVADATPQLMVWQCALHALLHVLTRLMDARLLQQSDDDGDPAMAAAAAALNTLRRHSIVPFLLF